MKYNYNNFLKKNYLFVGLLVFAYLFYIINNNNFYESFIIFIILVLGYLLINFKIFYILLLLIIISNLFFNFNKLIEGNTSDCPYISDSIKKIIEEQSRKTKTSLTTTPNSELVKKTEEERIGDIASDSARDIDEFNELDENSDRADISDDCANKMTEPSTYIPKRSYPSVCPQPPPSEILGSSVKHVSVQPNTG
jgi:hypothetical protein